MFDVLSLVPHGNNIFSIENKTHSLFDTSKVNFFSFYPKIIPLAFFESIEDKKTKKLLQNTKNILNKAKIELTEPHFIQKSDLTFCCVNAKIPAIIEQAETKSAKSTIFFENKMILGFSADKIAPNEQPNLSFESETFDVYQIALFRFEEPNADGPLSFKYEIIDSVWG